MKGTTDAGTTDAGKREPVTGPANWFVYMLACRDGSIYTGITTDPERRFQEHNAGKASAYTRSRTPVKPLYQEPASSHSQALQREMEIKGWPRHRKLELAGLAEDHA